MADLRIRSPPAAANLLKHGDQSRRVFFGAFNLKVGARDVDRAARLDPVAAGRRLANYLKVMTLEAQTIARACGKNKLHNLEPEDLCALTMEAAAMAQVPLAGTSWFPGKGGF